MVEQNDRDDGKDTETATRSCGEPEMEETPLLRP